MKNRADFGEKIVSTSLGAPSSSGLHGKASQALFFSQLLLLGKNAKGKGTLSEAQGNKASGSSPQCSHKRIVDHRSFSDSVAKFRVLQQHTVPLSYKTSRLSEKTRFSA